MEIKLPGGSRPTIFPKKKVGQHLRSRAFPGLNWCSTTTRTGRVPVEFPTFQSLNRMDHQTKSRLKLIASNFSCGIIHGFFPGFFVDDSFRISHSTFSRDPTFRSLLDIPCDINQDTPFGSNMSPYSKFNN